MAARIRPAPEARGGRDRTRAGRAAVGLALAWGAVALGVACSGTTPTSGVPPVTGVVVRAESVTAERGCGRAATNVFKFVAVVFGSADGATFDVPIAASVQDCFSDAAFVDLPAVGGRYDYRIQVYAYNERAYTAAKAVVDATPSTFATAPADALAALAKTQPTWTTTCSATEIGNVQALALCSPLATGVAGVSGDAGTSPTAVTLSLASFASADGGAFACDADYVSARVSYTVGGATTDLGVRRCSQPGEAGLVPVVVEVSPATAPASYAFHVALLRTDDSVVAQTTCEAATSPGLSSSASCAPAQ